MALQIGVRKNAMVLVNPWRLIGTYPLGEDTRRAAAWLCRSTQSAVVEPVASSKCLRPRGLRTSVGEAGFGLCCDAFRGGLSGDGARSIDQRGTDPMMEKTTAQALVAAISEGRACLLLGQDHTKGLVESVVREASNLSSTGFSSLREALSRLDASTLTASMAEFVATRHVPLVELASLPWTSVVSTAVDRGFLDAVAAAGTSRRLVETAAERIALTAGAHSPATLHLFHVLGRTGASGDLAPPSSDTLPGKLLLKLPPALDALPQLLGTRGVLVVEGMSPAAWLDDVSWAVLGQVLRKIPAGRVFWFGWAPPSLRNGLAELVTFEDERLTSALARWASDDELSGHLAAGRETVFGVDDHVFTVGVRKDRKTVRFSAKDWREIRRVGSVVDDAELDDLCASASDRQKGGLASFVGRAHIGVPDWPAAAGGYCFPRDATNSLVDAVAGFLASPKQSLRDARGGGPMRRPLLLSGPPAIGKSVGLLHVAWQLRNEHRAFVLWLLPGLSGIDSTQLERVVRMAESRGIPWTVLVTDGALPDECVRVLDKLLADGRRVVLLGTETAFADGGEPARGYTRFPLGLTFSRDEASRWSGFLAKHGLEDPGAGGRDFLSRLSRVLPEVGYGSTAALLQEYERVIRAAQPSSAERRSVEGPLAEQLRALFPELVADAPSDEPSGRFEGDPFVRDLVETILFCAATDLPVATDTLFVVLGSDLLSSFDRIERAFGETALIQEVALDHQGTIALTTAHRLHAQWLLRAVRASASSQLDVLRKLVDRVPWDLDAYPGDNPTQDYLLRVLRQVGPRGGASTDFGSIPALRTLANILSDIWKSHGKRHPGLLSLEAIIRGDIAQRDAEAPAEEKRQQCHAALELLDAAIEILRARRPTEARSFELQRALTLAADIRGTDLNIILREVPPSPQEVREVLRALQADVMMARSYDTRYHPLDILYWANRDARKLLGAPAACEPDLDAELLSTMQMALEVAGEEQIVDEEQQDRLDGRRIELDSILGAAPLAKERAAEMRARGNFAGELVLSRIAIEEAEHEPATCRGELERFLSYGAVVLSDVRVLRYLCRLWIAGWAGSKFGTEHPVCCSAPATAWEHLLHVARARLAIAEDSEHPLTTFLLGWAQLQLGDADGARETFTRLERRSIGMRRRVGELAIVSAEDGRARPYAARVQARRGDRVVLRIESLGTVLDMRPEVETQVAPSGLEIGEVVRVAIAINYRGFQVRALSEGGEA